MISSVFFVNILLLLLRIWHFFRTVDAPIPEILPKLLEPEQILLCLEVFFLKKTFFVNLKLFISYFFFLRNACWSWPVRRRSYWEGWEKIQAILWYELCHCYAKTQRYALAFYLFTFLISCLFIFWTITICFPFYLGGVAEYRASEGKTVEVPYRGIFQ